VPDAEATAGERVEDAAVAGAVVGDQLLNLDAVAPVKGDGTSEEAGRCRGRLIVEDFGVCEPAVVVDCAASELAPTTPTAALACRSIQCLLGAWAA
jgi:hypothetical protein